MVKMQWYILVVFISSVVGQRRCPPQESIVPCRCLLKNNNFQLWCSHSDLRSVLEGLKAVGQLISDPVDELILENNYLPALPGRAFLPLKVVRLMLRYNGLERVSSDWLSGLESSLMELFIVEPELRSLPEDTLMHHNNIQAITIQSNLMKRYPIFSGLPKLKYLQLESLSLLELSPRIFKNLESLEIIHIANSPRLVRLEAGVLEDLPVLIAVNISYCGINWMHPRAITRLPLLKELSLVGNKIVDVGMVGRGSRDLPQLEILRLDHNYIDKVTEASFVDIPTLKKIYLSNNQITELEYGAFHRVPSLRSLDLNKNLVRRVHPESFLQHSGSGLEELWMIDNEMRHVAELRSLLDALPRLIFLEMSHNKLEEIPFGALRGHPTLERLHLDHNKIRVIDIEAFMAMPALRELRLRNNSLSDVLDGPPWNLPALKGLDLSANFFRRLTPRFLANLPSLRRLDMSQNEISIIEPETFITTPALEHINLSGNALATLHPATFRHLHNLYDLDVNDNLLLEFVPNLPRGIEYLHISGNEIEQIPDVPDLDLPSLRMLDMSNNNLGRLPGNSLRSLPQLRRLYLGQNKLHKLEETSLSGLSRMEILDFRNNQLNQIHPNALSDMTELRELNLKSNNLDVLFGEIFRDTPHLKKLDVSSNQLGEILPGTLDKIKNVQIMDFSSNFLVQLPPNMSVLKKLKSLDFTNNRLKIIQPEILSNLRSLHELKLNHNFIQEVKAGAFDNLQHLTALHLNDNVIEVIEKNAIKSLPKLRSLKISKNSLREIPSWAFNDLPSLQEAELQENQIKFIAKDAFHLVPHLLVLNLSQNHLTSLGDTGVPSLKSLEMLDVSGNKIRRVGGENLSKMEWLVELRMNHNDICAIHGSPFDGMPRLRVLNLRNNNIMSLSEKSMQKLRSNIALLDLDGNPLACTCGLLWLQAWLQESSSMGPRCLDGSLLREMRLSRQECSSEQRDFAPIPPGCEAELLSIPGSPHSWMNLKSNVSQKVTPEESEYFYDEYVDYPLNGSSEGVATTVSPHLTPGDTPTLYAAATPRNRTIPKGVANSPSSSGFTFFGLPLPNLNNLLSGVGRADDKKPKAQLGVQLPTAERKTAIVNNPLRNGGRVNLPDRPHVESGGFIPLLPGLGGFKPIPSPVTQPPLQMTTPESRRKNGMDNSVSTPTIIAENFNTTTTTTTLPTSTKLMSIPSSANNASSSGFNASYAVEEITETSAKIIEVVTGKPTSTTPEIETASSSSNFTAENVTTQVPEGTIPSVPFANKTASSLLALLAPGGQQPEFRPAGKPTITKVYAPRVSASLLSGPEALPHNREGKAPKEYIITEPSSSIAGADSVEDDTSWYFANYNKSNVEHFIGNEENYGVDSDGARVQFSLSCVLVVTLNIVVL